MIQTSRGLTPPKGPIGLSGMISSPRNVEQDQSRLAVPAK